jgi:hypothetical protein
MGGEDVAPAQLTPDSRPAERREDPKERDVQGAHPESSVIEAVARENTAIRRTSLTEREASPGPQEALAASRLAGRRRGPVTQCCFVRLTGGEMAFKEVTGSIPVGFTSRGSGGRIGKPGRPSCFGRFRGAAGRREPSREAEAAVQRELEYG